MRRRYRVLRWSLLALFALPLLLLLGVYVTANTASGCRLIEHLTADLTHGKVLLTGLDGHFPERLRLKRLELRDPQGLWLSIENAQLEWSPAALLSYRADVSSLSAAHVEMPRAPAYPNDHQPSRRHHWPQLQFDRLEVERADLGAPLTGSAVAFELTGRGVWVSLQQASLQFEARRLDAVPSLYRASAQFDAQQLQAQLDLQEDADGPLAHLARVPAIGALAIHLSLAGPREAVKTTLALEAGALSAHADGTIDGRTGAANLQLVIDGASAQTPRPGIGWQRLHLSGHWQGAWQAPTITAQLEASGVVMPGVQLATLTATLNGKGGTLGLDAGATGLMLPGRLGTLLAASPVSAQATMHLDQPGRPIDVSASHALLRANGRWSGTGADGTALLTATLNDLKPLAALASLDLTGHGTLDAKLHTGPNLAHLEVSSALAVDGGRAPLASLLGPNSSFVAALNFDPRGIEVMRAQLSSARAQAAAHGRIDSAMLDLNWNLVLPDLAVLSPRLAGTASAQGQLQGEAPRFALNADIDGQLGINGTQSGALHLKLRARDLPQRPMGEVAFTGTLDQAPIAFDASIQGGADGALDVRIDRGSWKSLQAQGEVRVSAGSGAPHGRLELNLPHLEDLANLLGQPLQGSLSARAEFDGSAPGGRAHVHVEAKNAGVPAQQLTALDLSGNIDSVTTNPTLALRLSTQTLIRDVPSNLWAQIQGPLSAASLRVLAATEGDETTRSRLEAAATFNADRRELQITALDLKYRGEGAILASPTLVSFADGLSVDRLRLNVGASALELRGRLAPTLDLTASLHNLTSDLLQPWLPNVRADGQVDVDVELHGSATAPTGSVRLIGRGLRAHSGAVRGLPAGSITMEAQLQQTVAQVKLEADAGERLRLQIEGQAPLTRTAPIALKANGTFDLVLLNPILEAGGQRVHGETELHADIGGTLADPQAHGNIVLMHAETQDYARGLHLTDINGSLIADGNQLTLQSLVAHAGPGTISAKGSLGLQQGMPLSLQLEAHNARPFASDLITANADMDLTIRGPLRQQLEAAGKLHVIRADLNIPNALPPNVAVLDVRKPGQQVQPQRPNTFMAALDLTVDAPRAVFVRGRGLNAELGGSLHVGGTAAEPNISGGFDMRSGTINLAGSTLTFTSGRLSFNGSGLKKRVDPTLDFTATNVSGGVTYTLNVGGYADAPLITLSSTPEQPQDQILSRLLFGADPAQLSTLQVAQIAAALATMSGIGGGLNPLTAVQRKLRLDRLAINSTTNTAVANTAAGNQSAQGSNTGATIEAGRYVSSRVYVGAKQFTTGTTQAQVQVDLTRSLKVQAAVGTGGGTLQGETPQNDPGSSVGLSYQFEY